MLSSSSTSRKDGVGSNPKSLLSPLESNVVGGNSDVDERMTIVTEVQSDPLSPIAFETSSKLSIVPMDVDSASKSTAAETVDTDALTEGPPLSSVAVRPEDSPGITNNNNKAPPAKCHKCNKRAALKDCTLDACLQCCDDPQCQKHRKSKDQALWRQRVLDGSTVVQKTAKRIRSSVIPKGRFKETGFVYQGDTVVIWNLLEYLANPKWRDDALRKSNRRRARDIDAALSEGVSVSHLKPARNNGRRFRTIMDDSYKRSLGK